jgi:tRNA/rRNA methyltransferase
MVAQLRVVLVEPREAGNVGAVARAMKNFGYADLVIVGEHPPLERLAEWWSSGAEDVLEQIRYFDSLALALADANMTIATSSSRGRIVAEPMLPAAVGALAGGMEPDQRLAIVFGREDRGLTAEEVALCQRTAVIPTDARFPVMNLAQSVSIFSYAVATAVPRGDSIRALAPAALLERFHERFEALLLESGFLRDENRERIYPEIRAMFGRTMLDARETEILLGIVRQLEWAVRRER